MRELLERLPILVQADVSDVQIACKDIVIRGFQAGEILKLIAATWGFVPLYPDQRLTLIAMLCCRLPTMLNGPLPTGARLNAVGSVSATFGSG